MNLSESKLFKNTRIPLEQVPLHFYDSGSTVSLEGEITSHVGLVLEGTLLLKSYTENGHNFTLTVLNKGDIFGATQLFSSSKAVHTGTLVAKSKTTIALIERNTFKEYLFHDQDFLQNYLELMSDAFLTLQYKARLCAQDTLRDKLLLYLHEESQKQDSKKVYLPGTKEELANQLFVQRPSLSRELKKMKEDGLIEYDRTSITLL